MPHALAERLKAVKPSATLAMSARAAELRKSGRKIYAFGVGEPDFPTPAFIREAAEKALATSSHYTAVSGTAELKQAIVEATARDRGWTPTPDRITVSVGAKHALFNLAAALVDPGDEVVIPAPYWVSYPEQVRLFGGVPVIVDTRAENGFRMTPDELAAGLGPKTKAVILCTPSNPTGAAYTADELRALARVIADRSDAYLIADEIYGELVYDGFRHESLAKLAPELADRIIVVDGVSKAYAMTGWRIGWAIAPKEVTQALDKVQGQSTTNPTAVAQAAAVAALRGPRDEVRRMVDVFSERRRRMVDGLRAVPGIRCDLPRGAFYAFPDVTGLYGIRHGGRVLASADDVTLWQLDVCGIAAVAGEPFGAPGHIRYTYASAESVIDEALAALKAAVERAER
ncbi:MAG TPA: pyridoxal phosphate-dependent aminotransferase [Polyangiaceae bacterium]|jgi:aspartate aminotransferase|nr:pyridoxal phosphate-dependent aminotransferase [Polyangiaceae bacterium]